MVKLLTTMGEYAPNSRDSIPPFQGVPSQTGRTPAECRRSAAREGYVEIFSRKSVAEQSRSAEIGNVQGQGRKAK